MCVSVASFSFSLSLVLSKPPGERTMSSGGEIAFVALHRVVKFLDHVVWILGRGLLATIFSVVARGNNTRLPCTPHPTQPPPAPSFDPSSVGHQNLPCSEQIVHRMASRCCTC